MNSLLKPLGVVIAFLACCHYARLLLGNVVNSSPKSDPFEIPAHLQREHFDKLKLHSKSSITIDHDLWHLARNSMHTSLYAKFLSKALPLDQAKLALADSWQELSL